MTGCRLPKLAFQCVGSVLASPRQDTKELIADRDALEQETAALLDELCGAAPGDEPNIAVEETVTSLLQALADERRQRMRHEDEHPDLIAPAAMLVSVNALLLVQGGDQPKISGGPARSQKVKKVVHTAKRLPYEVEKRWPGEATGGLRPVRH